MAIVCKKKGTWWGKELRQLYQMLYDIVWVFGDFGESDSESTNFNRDLSCAAIQSVLIQKTIKKSIEEREQCGKLMSVFKKHNGNLQ